MKARVSINQFTGSRSGMMLSVKDDESGLIICEVEMDFEQFGRCVSGSGDKVGEIRTLIKPEHLQNVGKTREWKYVSIKLPEGVTSISRYSSKESELLNKLISETLIARNLTEHNPWKLSDSGLSSQQHTPGVHKITIYRYAEKGGSDAQESRI